MYWWDFQIGVLGPDMYGGRGIRRIGRRRHIGPLARNIGDKWIRRTWSLGLDERRIRNCNECMTHLVVCGDWTVRVTGVNFHTSSYRPERLSLNQLFPVSDVCDRSPRVLYFPRCGGRNIGLISPEQLLVPLYIISNELFAI